MDILTKLTSVVFHSVPAVCISYACPDPSTVEVHGLKVNPPSGYMVENMTPIKKDMRSMLVDNRLITEILNKNEVKLHGVNCTYYLGEKGEYGAFRLVRYYLNIKTTDKILNQTGWEAHNNRKYFTCVNGIGATCGYS